jgi:hypothetical protein
MNRSSVPGNMDFDRSDQKYPTDDDADLTMVRTSGNLSQNTKHNEISLLTVFLASGVTLIVNIHLQCFQDSILILRASGFFGPFY